MRAWEEFLTKQDSELGKETVDKWLRPLKMVRFDACNLYLEAGDSFQAEWFEEHVRSRVQKGLYNNNHKPIKIHISLPSQKKQGLEHKSKKKGMASASASFTLRFDEIDPEASFDHFVSSKENLLAYKLLNEIGQGSENGQQLGFNPIYLYGRSGTGKSHLLMACAAKLRDQGKKALYVRADTFTEHVVEAIRAAEMQNFRKAYRGVDALLIDDIEVFSRKNATQEELFHTFNTLHLEGKQIVLSGSYPPSELKFIEQRLVSRFEWGIVVPLHMPQKTDLMTILHQKAERIHFPIAEPVCSFLLDTFGNNTKSLLRALEALVLRTHLNQGLGHKVQLPLTLKSVQQTLHDLIQEEERSVLTPEKIIRAVAEYYGIHMDDILSKSQTRECVLPRQIAMHLCRQQLNLPYLKIGDIFSRDHSTVMASVKQVQKGLESKNLDISAPFNTILKLLLNRPSPSFSV